VTGAGELNERLSSLPFWWEGWSRQPWYFATGPGATKPRLRDVWWFARPTWKGVWLAFEEDGRVPGVERVEMRYAVLLP
jgi:hypothetical protein